MAKKKPLSNIKLSAFQPASAVHKEVAVACRILIVCEGTKTEPNYFKSFDKMQRGGRVYEVICEGLGTNTVQVVDKAIELRDKAANSDIPYDSVWAVFDKDSFPSHRFNAAIMKAEAAEIKCAWSNEAFELWYLYHFVNVTSATPRSKFQAMLEDHIGREHKGFKYHKNDMHMRELLMTHGDEAKAIKLAERQANSYGDKRYAEHNPATHVYKLVRLLRGEDADFNASLMPDLE